MQQRSLEQGGTGRIYKSITQCKGLLNLIDVIILIASNELELEGVVVLFDCEKQCLQFTSSLDFAQENK